MKWEIVHIYSKPCKSILPIPFFRILFFLPNDFAGHCPLVNKSEMIVPESFNPKDNLSLAIVDVSLCFVIWLLAPSSSMIFDYSSFPILIAFNEHLFANIKIEISQDEIVTGNYMFIADIFFSVLWKLVMSFCCWVNYEIAPIKFVFRLRVCPETPSSCSSRNTSWDGRMMAYLLSYKFESRSD